MNFSAPSDCVSQRGDAVDDLSPRKVIQMASYNIRSVRGGGLESILWAFGHMDVDLGLLCETKLYDNKYTKFSSNYHVFASKASNSHSGGVALVYRQSHYWQVESERVYGPNVISFKLVSGS